MIDERLRLSIHAKLTDLIGHNEADAIIAHIMPVPWHDVATHDDIHVVRNDLSVTRAELRAEMAGMRGDLMAQIADVRTDLKVEMRDMRVEMRDLMVGQTRWLMGYVTAFGMAMLAVARLLF